MADLQVALDALLGVLLVVVLFRAVPLQRALARLTADRDAFAALLEGFGADLREAERAIGTLRSLTGQAELHTVREAEQAAVLKNDLEYLIDRGDQLADRLDGLVRIARPIAAEAPRLLANTTAANSPNPHLRANQTVTLLPPPPQPQAQPNPQPANPAPAAESGRVRSQAERDLLLALRASR